MNFKLSKTLKLNNSLRTELSGPFGRMMSGAEFLKNVPKDSRIFAVGDVTLAFLLKNKYRPVLGIFDYRTKRSRTVFPEIKRAYSRVVKVSNPRGTLSPALWNAVKRHCGNKVGVGIRVIGEEDLASLACIYFARKGNLVIYGIRGKGMAVIRVGPRMKAYVVKVLGRMSNA